MELRILSPVQWNRVFGKVEAVYLRKSSDGSDSGLDELLGEPGQVSAVFWFRQVQLLGFSAERGLRFRVVRVDDP